MATCGKCRDGWICEDHPDQPLGHEHCGSAGMPCQYPECPYIVKRTGLVCPKCKRSMGEIEHQTQDTRTAETTDADPVGLGYIASL
jgi:hypothetical protein